MFEFRKGNIKFIIDVRLALGAMIKHFRCFECDIFCVIYVELYRGFGIYWGRSQRGGGKNFSFSFCMGNVFPVDAEMALMEAFAMSFKFKAHLKGLSIACF